MGFQVKKLSNQLSIALLAVSFLATGCVVGDEPVLDGETYSKTDSDVSRFKPGYIAVGDSIDFGIGATDYQGFVPQFHAYLEDAYFGRTADLSNIAVPGATSVDILRDQLFPAQSFIVRHWFGGVVVSVGAGGNNLLQFMDSPEFGVCFLADPTQCFLALAAIFDQVEADLDTMVKKLRWAAWWNPIVMRTYYNPLARSVCDPTGGALGSLGNAAMEGIPGTPIAGGLNGRIRKVAAKYHAIIADTFYPIIVDPNALIADDCVHPNDDGHDAIAGSFIGSFDAAY